MVPRAAQTSQLNPEDVLEHLLVNVARFMRLNNLYKFAEQVANTVTRAANTKLLEHGAAALPALDHRMAERQLPALPVTPPAGKQPGLVESIGLRSTNRAASA
jgi:hypothetical protein